jgi:hypothetical protein
VEYVEVGFLGCKTIWHIYSSSPSTFMGQDDITSGSNLVPRSTVSGYDKAPFALLLLWLLATCAYVEEPGCWIFDPQAQFSSIIFLPRTRLQAVRVEKEVLALRHRMSSLCQFANTLAEFLESEQTHRTSLARSQHFRTHSRNSSCCTS